LDPVIIAVWLISFEQLVFNIFHQTMPYAAPISDNSLVEILIFSLIVSEAV
jgi:hypothetical protein